MKWLIFLLAVTTILLLRIVWKRRYANTRRNYGERTIDFYKSDELERELRATEEFLIKFEKKKRSKWWRK